MKKTLALVLALVLALSASAVALAENANFTPSVVNKLSPTVVPVTGEDGQQYAAVVTMNGGEKIGLSENDLVLVPYLVAEQRAEDDPIREQMEKVYQGILAVPSLGDLLSSELTEDGKEQTIAQALEAALKAIGSEAKLENLVVRDLFYISLGGEYAEYLADEESYIELTFDLKLEPHAQPTVLAMQCSDGAHWTVLKPENVSVDEETGYVTVRLYDEGVLAFVTDSAEYGN